METLYRKYRPQKFSEITGQNHIRLTLEGELKSGRIAHAYIFSGPRGVGKTTIARIFAKAVNCLGRKDGVSESCGKCEACEEIQNGRAMDIIEIDAASNTGVDHVREHIIDNSRFAPSRWKYKVFIIDEVHMLSTSAFNALLKTLEEPPAHAIFILATTELHKVPETIVSRCQRFDFKRVPNQEIVSLLKSISASEGIKVDPKIFDIIARVSEGCPRDAESLLGQVFAIDSKEITMDQASLVLPESHHMLVIEFIGLLAGKNTEGIVHFVNRIVDEGVEIEAFTKEVIFKLREILLNKIEQGDNFVATEFDDGPRDSVGAASVEFLVKSIERLSRAKVELSRTDIVQLPLELAVVELCLGI